MTRGGSVYILTNKNHTVLYIGVTSNLFNRISEHRSGVYNTSFTKRYNLELLIYFENFSSIEEAINREKEIKKWSRKKKEKLINRKNPLWNDLSCDISEY
ncbi:GIY-YIG nuclease family protein [Mangrovivirga sp. M17]|uniref:GIY-YIG nuclease family protein n=1 Tax=Mangrovivirga halotolerans TaxID=2993936 RepID=A0ABT3RWG9_9BACT|nr:GIY-YIG nuclease family protein [Mangrovivirga halotolerans]MCX2745965.1 GIY-YIG nuclease family protein [Mangrovivirga halotolerans]